MRSSTPSLSRQIQKVGFTLRDSPPRRTLFLVSILILIGISLATLAAFSAHHDSAWGLFQLFVLTSGSFELVLLTLPDPSRIRRS